MFFDKRFDAGARGLIAAMVAILVLGLVLAITLLLCGCNAESAEGQDPVPTPDPDHVPRLALWLAKKDELIAHQSASYDLVLTAWFEPDEARAIRERTPSAILLAGLTHTWIWDKPFWLPMLIIVANGGDQNGPLQITDDMYLMFDDNGDGVLDRRCALPGWPELYAMDPRHPGWRELIASFYAVVAEQSQHDGVVVDMVDAYPFCDGAASGGVPAPLDADTWVSAQSELLALIREQVPSGKWLFVNAGHNFPEGSPFPQHVNGYVLENFLGSWGSTLTEGLASAERALTTTQPPHAVVLAVDTDDTGAIDWPRVHTGLAASLLMDNTYFAFDYGPRDHGGVTDWWLPEYDAIDLGAPSGPYVLDGTTYRRDFENGLVVVAAGGAAEVSLEAAHQNVFTQQAGTQFTVAGGDAGIFMRVDE